MLREINLSASNNTASHQLSNSQLTTRNMPQQESLVDAIDAAKQGETDQRQVGVNTSPGTLDNFIDYLA